MQRHLMKSKIHWATVTSADLHHEGSLTVDQELVDAADLVILISYGICTDDEGERHSPAVVLVDSKDRIVRPQLRAES